jgi:methyl-accepting chemotaxis protein
MAKKNDFDLNAIKKKMNLGGIMDNVKSIISPTSISIDAKDGDQIGALLAQLNELVKEVAIAHEEQEKRLGNISRTSAQIHTLLQAHAEADAQPVAEKPAEQPAEKPADDDDA